MEIPQAMIDSQARQMADEFAQRLQMQGMQMDQYLRYTGLDADKFVETTKPQALKRIQTRLVLEAVVKAENIQVPDEELEKEFEEMAKAYRMETDKLKDLIGEKEKEQMKMDLAVSKAVDLVAAAAKEV